jgi:amidohydrolase
MDIQNEITRAIDDYRQRAVAVGQQIHARPELKFKEEFSSDLLARSLSDLGLSVERGVGELPTAFRATFGRGGPTIAILAEYDALPNGHSCGHNLIAGAALAATAGLARVRDQLPGRIMILGTPAEEGGGGKILLIRAGALQGVDAAMMVHPTDVEFSTMPALATRHLKFTFHGKAAHAAAAPWDGSSALAAVLQTFQSVDTARVHFRDGSRLHGIITNGGQAVNIIPELAMCEFLARARTSAEVDVMADRIVRCADAAATATGTRFEQDQLAGGYKNMINNMAMADRYSQHSERLGVRVRPAPVGLPTGSTDMGDVSHVMPAIHPVFRIADAGQGNCHEDAFVRHANSARGYEAMIRVAKAMALTAYDLLAEPELLRAAKAEFAERRET